MPMPEFEFDSEYLLIINSMTPYEKTAHRIHEDRMQGSLESKCQVSGHLKHERTVEPPKMILNIVDWNDSIYKGLIIY